MLNTMEKREYEVAPEEAGERLDRWIHARDPEWSRTRWQSLIRGGYIRVDGETAKAGLHVQAGMRIEADIPVVEPAALEAEDIPLHILFEDGDIIVIDKPPGRVTHPSAGHAGGTLVNALLAHCPDLAGINGTARPGIVHRLDKDTSGVLVAAKNEPAMKELLRQFKEREVRKEYLALVHGLPQPPTGCIELPIGRSPHDRRKMAVDAPHSRSALTHYRVEENYGRAALVRLRIETGRTHQIRVHMAHRGHPVIGDREYGRGGALRAPRQMLHAHRLAFTHPILRVELEFTAPIPQDMQTRIRELREDMQ